MFDLENLSLDHVWENLPRKDGAPDIGELEYDPALIPYLVALVTQKKLRAVFLSETKAQTALRQEFLSSVNIPEFWKAIGTLTYRFSDEDVSGNNTVYPVNIYDDEPQMQIPSIKRIMLDSDVPSLINHTVTGHADILRASFVHCTDPEAMIFGGRENGGILARQMHTDPHYTVSVHKTVHGRRGMGYVLDPLSEDQKEFFERRPNEFRQWLYDGGLQVDIIPTGTTTIFGTFFLHESSPEEQVSVVMSANRPYELVHEG